jgi:hypothetical protein
MAVLGIALSFLNIEVKAQSPWAPLGRAGFSAADVTYTFATTDTGGRPYVIYGDYSKGLKATLMKYNDTGWTPIGGEGFSKGWVALSRVAIDKHNTPFVAFEEYTDRQYMTTVMRYDGTTWNRLGLYGPQSNHASYLSLKVNSNSEPYVTYKDTWDTSYGKVSVKKWNGSDWQYVGKYGFSMGEANYMTLAIDPSDVPYVAYHEVANGYKASVRKFDGTDWVLVGKYGISSGTADYVYLALDKTGTPFIAFGDGDHDGKATVMKYDGTNWVIVGSAGFTAGLARYISLAIGNDGNPYIAYQDNAAGDNPSVMRYNGKRWVRVGNPGFSTGGAEFVSLALGKNDSPYVAFKDNGNLGHTTVMGYYCGYPVAKTNICAALVDTITGNNKIVWDAIADADSYLLYREDAGVYNLLATLPDTADSYVDVTANPSAQSYKYKLVVRDKCWRETDVDSAVMHNTVRLAFNNLFAGDVYIGWNSYKGIPGLNYYTVKRSNNGGAFTTIAAFSISGDDTTYTDVAVPAGTNTYRIDMGVPSPCIAGGVTYNIISSNTVSAWPTGVSTIENERSIVLMPNPADKELQLNTTEAITHVNVYSLTGKLLIAQKGNGGKQAVVDVTALAPGMYIISVNDVQRATFVKR